MAWTAFPTWIVGQVSLASDWNTYVANNMQTLATPPLGLIYQNVGNTLNNNGGTYCQMQLSAFLRGGMTYGAAAPGTLTIPVAGIYSFSGQGKVASIATGGGWGFGQIWQNGAGQTQGAISTFPVTNPWGGYVSTTLICAANDLIALVVEQHSGANQTTSGDNNTFLFGQKVSN